MDINNRRERHKIFRKKKSRKDLEQSLDNTIKRDRVRNQQIKDERIHQLVTRLTMGFN